MVSNDPESVVAQTSMVDPESVTTTLVCVDERGQVRTGARAVFTVVGLTGGVTGAAGRVLSNRLLSALCEPGYRIFARNRGRLARWFHE